MNGAAREAITPSLQSRFAGHAACLRPEGFPPVALEVESIIPLITFRKGRSTTWRIDYYTQTVTAPVSITDILSPTRAYTLTGLTNYAWYTVTLNAMLGSTPFLTDTVRVMPADRFVYLPLITRGNQ